jgi:hypothetical protein
MRNKGGLVIIPSAALETMNLGTVLGAKAYQDQSLNPPSAGHTPIHNHEQDKGEDDNGGESDE